MALSHDKEEIKKDHCNDRISLWKEKRLNSEKQPIDTLIMLCVAYIILSGADYLDIPWP